MQVDRRSPVVVGVIVGCVAGVVAFLASSQNNATVLSSAPVSTSSRVVAVPSMAIPQYTNVEPQMASYAEASGVDSINFEEVSSMDQTKPWGAIVAGFLAVPLAAAGMFLFGKRSTAEERQVLVSIDDLVTAGKHALVASAVVGASATMVDAASAYPIFAQQAYTNPREATGRIVCANCHLASKPTEIELPQSVLPDQVFEAVSKFPGVASSAFDVNSVVGSVAFKEGQPVEFVQESGIPVSQALVEFQAPTAPNTVFKATIKVPYDASIKQVGGNGKPADLNVGAVLVLPEGFTLAPKERIPEKMKEEINGLQFIKYSKDTPNVLVVGPVPGKLYEEMHIALLSPDPTTDRNVHFGTLPVYVGGNRGRGQLYPAGDKSNNNAYEAVHAGKIVDIEFDEKKRVYSLAIEEPSKLITNEVLPAGAELLVKKGDVVQAGQTITTNPNIGGFGQAEAEIVLQDPGRVQAFLFFTFAVLGTQTMLVVKKKQYEQVQLSEMNF